VDGWSESERARLKELLALGAPAWMLQKEIGRSRWAIRRYVKRLQRPSKPVPEQSSLRLSLDEREEISLGLAEGRSMRSIAAGLGRAPSTVSREIAANGGCRCYRAVELTGSRTALRVRPAGRSRLGPAR
jgi:IS30 family transposase